MAKRQGSTTAPASRRPRPVAEIIPFPKRPSAPGSADQRMLDAVVAWMEETLASVTYRLFDGPVTNCDMATIASALKHIEAHRAGVPYTKQAVRSLLWCADYLHKTRADLEARSIATLKPAAL